MCLPDRPRPPFAPLAAPFDPSQAHWAFRLRCSPPPDTPPPDTPAFDADRLGGRRRRLWELDDSVHCPVVGVCFTSAEIRVMFGHGGRADALTDFELHTAVVKSCRRRDESSRRLHKRLDKRFADAIRRYVHIADSAVLLAQWRCDAGAGRVAEALWAALTHPACDAVTERTIYGEIHLLQHQSAAERRRDARDDVSFVERAARDRQELDTLRAEIARLRRERDDRLAGLGERLRESEAARHAMAARLASLAQADEPATVAAERRAQRAERAADRAMRELEALRRTLDAAPPADSPGSADSVQSAQETSQARQSRQWQETHGAQGAQGAPRPIAAQDIRPDARATGAEALPKVSVAGAHVLCVGGQSRLMPRVRAMLESLGARYDHHDGGREQSLNELEARLARADVVICHADCVSHPAYWRVKRYCRRAGKQCVFVEQGGLSSLARRLGVQAAEPAA